MKIRRKIFKIAVFIAMTEAVRTSETSVKVSDTGPRKIPESCHLPA
jgi:hypothetical protein